MGLYWRAARWAIFTALSILSYAVLAGVCQALTSLLLRFVNHDFDHSIPQFLLAVALLAAVSAAAFLAAGRVLAWALPLAEREAAYSLTVLGLICALIPVEKMPDYNSIEIGLVRCLLAALACALMVAGSRLRLRLHPVV